MSRTLASIERGFDIAARAGEALGEHGEGFTVSASYGAVLIPRETRDATRGASHRRPANVRLQELVPPQRSRQTTDVLVQVLAERDAALGDHLSAVARLAESVSIRLGLTREQADDVKRAASLHDIGKLAIPESILAKPGPLTASEWEFVRQHTLIGERERILSAAPSLTGCGKIVRSSHEWWDGTGYPDRLGGEEIPLAARIVFVCDAFEAMTSARPYCESRSAPDAVAELRRCAGTQFDPDVVQAFAEAFEAELETTPVSAQS